MSKQLSIKHRVLCGHLSEDDDVDERRQCPTVTGYDSPTQAISQHLFKYSFSLARITHMKTCMCVYIGNCLQLLLVEQQLIFYLQHIVNNVNCL